MSKKIKKTTNSQIHTPHDKIFKRSMRIPEVAKEFLIMHLPEDVKYKIDYTTLEMLPETFNSCLGLTVESSDQLVKR